MIIGGSKLQVIENIKRATESGELNIKVETGDPALSPEQSEMIVHRFLDNRSKTNYMLKTFIARNTANLLSKVLNKDSEIFGIEKLSSINGGAVITCNHFNPIDNTTMRYMAKKAGKKKIYTVAQETNFAMHGFLGFIMNYADTIPISRNMHYMQREFCDIISELVGRDEWVLIYPEQEMWFNYRKPRTVKPGAYYYAAKLNVPIISCFVEIQETNEADNEEFSKVKYKIHVLDTIYPDKNKSARENSREMQKKDYMQKLECYEKAYGKKYTAEFDISDIAGYMKKIKSTTTGAKGSVKRIDKTRYYKSFDQDFVKTAEQEFKLSDDYVWVRRGAKAAFLSHLTYGAAVILGGLYCKAILHISIKNKTALKQAKCGCFIFGNHTQPFGDVIIPALAALPKRIYTICSPSNLGMQGIGKALPYLGALPVPDSITGLKKLSDAVVTRINSGNAVVVYPEAHVWEYYTGIRPFSEASFLYPVRTKKPSFCMTAVYTKHKFFKRPKMTVYIDGPFYPDESLNQREQAKQLHGIIHETMQKRSKESNFDYIEYKKL